LLLGGLEREETVKSVNKVPLLGDIPLLGKLFRSESSTERKSERMFLISPRLIDPVVDERGSL
jgi:type II secretory pathway component GspD/PulD (secretin)